MHNKQKILDFIENNKYDYVEISHRIHERPELGNEEIFASRTVSYTHLTLPTKRIV